MVTCWAVLLSCQDSILTEAVKSRLKVASNQRLYFLNCASSIPTCGTSHCCDDFCNPCGGTHLTNDDSPLAPLMNTSAPCRALSKMLRQELAEAGVGGPPVLRARLHSALQEGRGRLVAFLRLPSGPSPADSLNACLEKVSHCDAFMAYATC